MELNLSIKTLHHLKISIQKTLNSSYAIEKMKIYNYKAIELDDADIEYLRHNQTLYLSIDGANFNALNYANEYKFVKWIKSGGYGKVYEGIDIT